MILDVTFNHLAAPRKTTYLLLIVLTIGCLLSHHAFASTPPSPEQVFKTIENQWESSQLDEFFAYPDQVLRDFPGYVPALAAKILTEYNRGAQSEKAIESLATFELRLKEYPAAVPYGYRKVIRSLMGEQKKLVEYFENQGQSVSERLEDFSPEKVYKGAGLSMSVLVTSAPPVSLLQSSDGQVAVYDFTPPPDDELKAMNSGQLVAFVKESMNPSRICAAISLMSTFPADEALPTLAGVIGSYIPFGKECAAKRISELGERAIPALLDILQSEASAFAAEHVIWALIRIGENSPQVRTALQAQIDQNALAAEYAQEALDYLAGLDE